MAQISIETIVGVFLAGGGSLLMYLLKQQLNDLKNTMQKHSNEINTIKQDYFQKADFREFKQELWARLDRFEEETRSRLNQNK